MIVPANAAQTAAGRETERFAVPMGRYLGYVVVIVCAVMIVLSIATQGVGGHGLIGFCFAFAMIAWVCLIRPQVSANVNGLLLRNMLRDTFLPWAMIRSCRVGQTLQVGTRDRIYHGLGISKSARASTRERRRPRPQTLAPSGGLAPMQFASSGTTPTDRDEAAPQVNPLKQEHVVNNQFAFAEQRIETLAQKGSAATSGLEPQVAWDPTAVVALTLAVVGIVGALFA